MTPWEQVGTVLREAKAQGLTWHRAWLNAMRAYSPPRTCGEDLRRAMADERELLHEVKPFLQAAYEDREVEASEYETAQAASEKRLDALMST